jgi:CheY-like chemotaxis protein
MTAAVTTGDNPLRGLSVLLVEDESMVSLLVEDMLKGLGCARVWQAATLAEATTALSNTAPDIAVLDLNLDGEFVDPLADRLAQASIPFVFATAYGRPLVPERWAARLVIQKPFRSETLGAALRAALAAARSRPSVRSRTSQ